ncbi:MAG: Gfo/Idh/MocA family oxidoreductase [Nitrospirota bacterium]|nr:MAG: Gfo/Idh/MocA family oxidoreductase [Nitrospirota bacterium]
MTPIGVGLIGLGRHGMRYARHLLEDIHQARLVAVCRRNAKEGLHFAKSHNLHFYKDFRDLIADPQVEAVLVVTAPSLTHPIGLEAIGKEKPLLIEKPLAIHGADARRIVESASAHSIPLMTAQTLRYDASILKLKELARRIGKWKYLPLTARMEHREHSKEDIQAWDNRGVVLEMGVHLFDLARFLTGEEIREVYCELDSDGPKGPEDQAWIRLTTHSGLPCFLDVSRVSSNRVTRAEIVGEKGQADADWSKSTVHLATHQNQPEEYQLPATHTLLSVLQDFFQALKNQSPMPITGLDGQRAVELADACYESAAAGRPIALR